MNNELWVLLDLRGLMLHSMMSGTDPDATQDAEGNLLITPGHTLTNFTNRYLLPILKEVPLNRIIAVNDAGNEYRLALFPGYKEGRPQYPQTVKDAMMASHKAVRDLLHSLGILQVSVAGTEADDVIAYLEENLPGNKMIYTVDGDMVALTKPSTLVFYRDQLMENFKYEDILVSPHHVTLFKSLCGDKSDKYLGIRGFGKKAWLNLLAEYGDDGIAELTDIAEKQEYLRIKEILDDEPGRHKLLLKIWENLSDWRLGYNLAKLHPELVGMRRGNEFRRPRWDKRVPSVERLKALTEKTGTGFLMYDLKKFLPTQTLITRADWDATALEEARSLFANSRYIALDWETWAPYNENFEKASTKGEYVDMLSSRITGVGITCGKNLEHTFYFQFEHADVENNIDKQHLLPLLGCIPEGMPVVIQNMMFEQTVLMAEFKTRFPLVYDTKIMASHVDEADSNGLKDLSKKWLNYDQIRYRDVIEKGKTMKDYPGHHVFQYGADDPLVTGHLFDLFQTIMYLEGTWEFVRDNEFNAVEQLVDSYLAGVSLDWEEVDRQHKEDALAFNTAISEVRELIKQNQTPELIEEGAEMWAEELTRNADALTLQLGGELFNLRSVPNLYEALQEHKGLWSTLRERVSELTTFEECEEAFREERARVRSTILIKAREAITYVDYVEVVEPVKFTFTRNNIQLLADSLHLPEIPGKLDAETWFEYHSEQTGLSPKQDEFVQRVGVVVCHTGSNRSQLPEYKKLAERFALFGSTSVKKSGTELNLNSPVQMQNLMYGTLALPLRVRNLDVSDTREELGLDGAPQANEDAIRTAIAEGDAPEGSWKRGVLDRLMIAKKADTRIKLFYNKFPLWKHPFDGLMHPQFNSVGTETRRPSGTSPNLLQLSKKGDGVKVRKSFLPNAKLGHDLVFTCDWAAQELRVIAALSGDETLTACYVGDNLLDVHSVTASGIMKVSYEDFLAGRKSEDKKRFNDARGYAKNTNFGSSYGIGPAKLARQILCSLDEARAFLEAKKAAMPGVETWKEAVKEELHAKGFVRTLFGSIKHVFNKIFNSDSGMVGYYERSTVNFEIQGVCADYLKKVLSDMWKAKTLQRHGAVLVAPIYDELVISMHSSQALSLIPEVYKIMTQGIPGIDIPMLAAPAVGVNFANQIEILADENDTLTEEKIMAAVNKALGIELQEAA